MPIKNIYFQEHRRDTEAEVVTRPWNVWGFAKEIRNQSSP